MRGRTSGVSASRNLCQDHPLGFSAAESVNIGSKRATAGRAYPCFDIILVDVVVQVVEGLFGVYLERFRQEVDDGESAKCTEYFGFVFLLEPARDVDTDVLAR